MKSQRRHSIIYDLHHIHVYIVNPCNKFSWVLKKGGQLTKKVTFCTKRYKDLIKWYLQSVVNKKGWKTLRKCC